MEAVIGGLAGLFSDAIVHPIDTIRARMQTQNTAKSATSILETLLKNEGGKSL